jgi:threonine/homoserine/homoserine lactone efflux protein
MTMVDWSIVPWGVATGLAVSAPLGPINFLCIRQTLRHGFWGGFFTGIGSVIGDGVFAAVAALGIKALSRFTTQYEAWLLLAGGLFLTAIGVMAFVARVDDRELVAAPDGGQRLALVATTLGLTLTNPFTFAGFVAIFGGASAGMARPDGTLAVVVLVGSVMAGSTLWWAVLARLVAGLRERLDARWVTGINRASGAAIVAFGLFVLGRLALTATG